MKYLKLYSCFLICFWTVYSSAERCVDVFDMDISEKLFLIVNEKNIVNKKSNDEITAFQQRSHIYYNMNGLALLADKRFNGLMTDAYEEAARIFTLEELHQLGWKYFIGSTAEFNYLNKFFIKDIKALPFVKDMYKVIRSNYNNESKYRMYLYQGIINRHFNNDPIRAFINLFALLDVKSFIRARWVPIPGHDIYYRKGDVKTVYQLTASRVLELLKHRTTNRTFHHVNYAYTFNKGVKWDYNQIANMIFGGDMFRAFVQTLPVIKFYERKLRSNNKVPANYRISIWKYPFIGSTHELLELVDRIKNAAEKESIWNYTGEKGLDRYASELYGGDKYKTYVNVYHALNSSYDSQAFNKLQWPEPPKLPINVLILLYDNLFTTLKPPISESRYSYKDKTTGDTIERVYQHNFPKMEYDVNAIHTNFMAYKNEVIDSFNELSQPRSFYLKALGL